MEILSHIPYPNPDQFWLLNSKISCYEFGSSSEVQLYQNFQYVKRYTQNIFIIFALLLTNFWAKKQFLASALLLGCMGIGKLQRPFSRLTVTRDRYLLWHWDGDKSMLLLLKMMQQHVVVLFHGLLLLRLDSSKVVQ